MSIILYISIQALFRYLYPIFYQTDIHKYSKHKYPYTVFFGSNIFKCYRYLSCWYLKVKYLSQGKYLVKE